MQWFMSYLMSAVKNGKEVGIQKGFDVADHGVLMDELQEVKIRELILIGLNLYLG